MSSLTPPDTKGFFWLPKSPDVKVPGRLYTTKEGTIELETLGTFSGDLMKEGTDDIPRILGISEQGKLITLERCFYRNYRFNFPGLPTATIHVNLALFGCHFDAEEQIEFDEIAFNSDAFDEWFRIAEIKVALSPKPYSVSINYSPSQKLEWPVSIGGRISLECAWTVPGNGQYREAKVTQKVMVGYRPEQERPLDELLKVIHRFCNFVSFVADQSLPIQAIHAYSNNLIDEIGEVKRRIPIDVYFASRQPEKVDLSRLAAPFPLFPFQYVRDRFGDVISRWLENYETFASSFNLYFATKGGRDLYLDNSFLMLIQALESLHRHSSKEVAFTPNNYANLCLALQNATPDEFKDWLEPRLKYGNELSLRQRLKLLFKGLEQLYSKDGDVKDVIAEIVDTRNYLTHYDQGLKARAAKGLELHRLCEVMESLFQIHMALLCGFGLEEVVELCKRSQLFSRKLNSS